VALSSPLLVSVFPRRSSAPPAGQDFTKAPSNHSPLFDIDEKQLPTGARSLAALAVDYLQRNP
jgi:amidohydrolase